MDIRINPQIPCDLTQHDNRRFITHHASYYLHNEADAANTFSDSGHQLSPQTKEYFLLDPCDLSPTAKINVMIIVLIKLFLQVKPCAKPTCHKLKSRATERL